MFTLDEAREAIKNKPEFVLREREFGFNIDYNVTFEETFVGSTPRETLILQNLRGTCFNDAGEIISLPYHKFHNLNENPEYHESKFDFRVGHVIQEKLDGSMIRPIMNFGRKNAEWEFGTRAGVTDVATKAWKLMDSWETTNWVKWKAYQVLINDCIELNLTPLFEFCSREQRIVIDYPEPKLVLTGVRRNWNGEYLSEDLMLQLARDHVDVVRNVYTSRDSIAEFASVVKDLIGEEGVVVKFDDGRFVKIKAADYVLKHRALDGLRWEKDVLKLIIMNQLDDVLPLVADDVKARLEKYRDQVQRRLLLAQSEMMELWHRHRHVSTKKEFAELIKMSPYKQGLFKIWDGATYSLENLVLAKSGSQTDVDSVRWLIGEPWSSI